MASSDLESSHDENALKEARTLLANAQRVAVLSGAGVSAESGVPTFRGEEGLWKTYSPEQLANPRAFRRDPRLVWEWYDWRRSKIRACRPNPGHEALACFALGYYRPGRYQPGAALGGLAGFGAGLLNGAFAIPGPPVIIYTMATEPDPARSRAFLLTFFLFMAAAGLLTYAAAGFVTAASPLYFLLAFPAMFIGDKLGYRLFQRYGTAGYRRVAVILLFVMGVAITAEALWW